MEPPGGVAAERGGGDHRENERAGPLHGDLGVVDALPLHLCLVVCDPVNVTDRTSSCQGINRRRGHTVGERH